MANMTFKANLLPSSNLGYNLGSSDQKWNVYGTLIGNADSATSLTSSAGSSTVPIYFSSGKPVQCSTTLGVSITGNAATATKISNTPNNTTTFLRGDNTWSANLEGNFTTSKGSIWAGTNGDTTAERDIGVRAGGGQIYLFSSASATGGKGLYISAHGAGSGKTVIGVDNDNNVTFSGTLSGNASSATQLITARTIWGQSFNGTANISGNMTNVGPNMLLPSGQTQFSFLTSGGGAGLGKFGAIGISSSYSDTDISTYGFDIYNKCARFRTANATLGIDSNYKIGTARKTIHIQCGNGSNSGLNDGYSSAITFGDGSAYAGIYYQSSGAYGSRLIFGTTNSYSNGTYGRVIITHDGKMGIGTMTPSYKLHVIGDVYANGGWLRSSGATGWYNESYGGGWYMSDSTYIRNYGSKIVLCNNEIISTSANAFRLVYGNYGIILRNDGGSFWMLPTASGNQYGSWNSSTVYTRVDLSTGRLYGAAWNDYAEFRKENPEEKGQQAPGRCVRELGNGALVLTTKRLERGCEIVSDTYGFAIGEDKDNRYTVPIASTGRVLAYPYESIEEFTAHIGWPVCSGPNGTVSIMTEEEEEKYPSRIIGTISEIPDYEEWGSGNVKVNGRVWIRIR